MCKLILKLKKLILIILKKITIINMKYFYIDPVFLIPIYHHFKIFNIKMNEFNEPHEMYKQSHQRFVRERNRKTKVKYFEWLSNYSIWDKSNYKIKSDLLKSFILWMGLVNPTITVLYTEQQLDQKCHSVKDILGRVNDIKYTCLAKLQECDVDDILKELSFINTVQHIYIDKQKKIELIIPVKSIDGDKRI